MSINPTTLEVPLVNNRGVALIDAEDYELVSQFDKWQAKIVYERVEFVLGRFNTPEEAARAYDTKAQEMYGEYAYTNF